MALQPNSMLGPYRIIEMIGEGGMGAVYRAQDTRLGRDVAVKILTAVTLSDKERLGRFAQEARTTGMLNHPNLLTIYDIGNAAGTPFLVSELLQGETLRDRVARGPMSPRKAIDAAQQMALGLTAAHEKGIVHRDLKPENIFLTKDGRLKILDFGIAKLTARGENEGPFQMAATEPGVVLGTVGYMAPEQVRGETVDQRADIFSFGTIVYEMLTGSIPFKRSSAIETLSAILREEPPDLSDVLPSTPPALDRLVRRCLEKDREVRFQTARDLAFHLETLSTMSTPQTLSATPNPVASPPVQSTPIPLASHAPTVRTPPGNALHGTNATTAIQPPIAVQRRPTLNRPLPRRRVSPLLLGLFFVVAIAGAGFGGWYVANRMHPDAAEPAFRRITFRRGEVRSARFSGDGETIVYSAAWDGHPSEIYIGNRQTPEARPLGISDADVLSISKSTELAILLHRDRITNVGRLARVPLAGGVPRELADGVLQADWSPDGSNLAALRVIDGAYRIEYPLGTTRYQTPHQIRDLRISPDGRKIAFIELHGGQADIAIVETGTPTALARGWSRGVTGISWSPDGREIWITATDTAAPPALYAISMKGDVRFVSRLTGSMKLFDISRAGNALLTNGTWRAALMWQPPGEAERDASWFDWSMLADLSADGRTVLFNETREGGGAKSAIYIRHASDPAPVRIGDGFGDALSPDGHWVLAHNDSKLVIVPTGTGDARELKVEGAFDNGAAWFNDSRRVVVGGAIPGHGYQLFIIDTLDETVKPVTPENLSGDGFRPFAISPDERFIAGMSGEQAIVLYPSAGSGTPLAVPAAENGEVPVRFSADGLALYVYRPSALPPQVTRIDLATGTRTLWKELATSDPAGVYKIAPVMMTADESSYAFGALRLLNDLYVAENLR